MMRCIKFNSKIFGLIVASNLIYLNSGCINNYYIAEQKSASVNINMSDQSNFNRNNNNPALSDGVQLQNKAADDKSTADNQRNLITNTSVGKVRIGMQMKEIKRNYPNSQFKVATSPLDNITSFIEVVQNNERLFYFTTENFSDVEEVELPDEADKIFFITTDNPRFVTAEGVKVGQTFNDAKQVYGEPQSLGHPFTGSVSFRNQAVKGIVFFSAHHEVGENKEYSPELKITHISMGKLTQ